MAAPQFIYRFRPMGALLGEHHELERQEIYFAPPSELNDPYDGAKEVQWTGDAILWSNLLCHYLLCTTQMVLLASIAPDDSAILERIPIGMTEGSCPTDDSKKLYNRVKTLFFAQPDATRLAELLTARPAPVCREELMMYLRMLLRQAIDSTLAAMEELGLRRGRPEYVEPGPVKLGTSMCCEMLTLMNAEEYSKAERRGLGELFGNISESFSYQQSLKANIEGKAPMTGMGAWLALHVDFPTRYVMELEKLLYNDWFTACFVDDPTDAGIWGTYGEGHRGAALKFKTHLVSDRMTLTLNGIIGFSSGKGRTSVPIYSDKPYEIHQVRYQSRFTVIDFFLKMGRITGADSRFWHYDAEGTKSPLMVAAGYGSEEWRKQYWRTITEALTTKHQDWTHERERRVVLQGSLIDYSTTKENRKLKYRFEDLEGIIFGPMTPAEQVVATVRIIRNKCLHAGRNEFKFFRARYSPRLAKMSLEPLELLKVA